MLLIYLDWAECGLFCSADQPSLHQLLVTINVQLGPPCKTINHLYLFSSIVTLWIVPLDPLSTNTQFINIVLSLSSSSSFFPNTLRDREILRQLPKWQVKWEQEALEREGCHGNHARRSDYMRIGQVNLQPYCIQRPGSTRQTKGHLTSITAHNPQPIRLDVIAIFVQRSDGCVHLGLWNTQYTFHPNHG